MNFSTETIGQIWAQGRNYINSGLGLLTGIGLMSAAQDKGLMDSLGEIYTGVSQVIHGATSAWQIIVVIAAPILTPVIAWFASKSAKTSNQAAAVVTALKDPNTPVTLETKAAVLDAVANIPEVKTPQIKVDDPALANMVPSAKVTT